MISSFLEIEGGRIISVEGGRIRQCELLVHQCDLLEDQFVLLVSRANC